MSWLCLTLLLGLILPVHAADLPPVRLGLVVPTTGEADPVAQGMRQAAEVAVSDWRPRLGRRIELRIAEDAFDPRQAAATAERLVADGVVGVVGHFYSSSSLAASVVYHAAGVPLLMPTATHPHLTAQGLGNVFRVCGRDDAQGPVAAEFVLWQVRARRIAVAHDRTEYGRGLVESFRREASRQGGGRVVLEESVAQGDRDFAAQVARVKSAQPEALYFGGVFREAGHLLRQLRRVGVEAAFVSGDAVLDPEFVRLAGEDAAVGAYLTSAPDPHLIESARPVIERYESRYGTLGPHALQTYDAVGVLLQAIHSAKPAGNSTGELEKVIHAIRSVPYLGSLGALRWDKNGDRTPAPYTVYVTTRGGRIRGWFEQAPGAPLGGAPSREQRR